MARREGEAIVVRVATSAGDRKATRSRIVQGEHVPSSSLVASPRSGETVCVTFFLGAPWFALRFAMVGSVRLAAASRPIRPPDLAQRGLAGPYRFSLAPDSSPAHPGSPSSALPNLQSTVSIVR